jgi:HK97 family phage major capsid protein
MPLSTANAPELTAEQVIAILVKPLEAKSVFLAARPRIFNVTAAGPVKIPKLVSMEKPSWHFENELIDEVDPDFDEVKLLDGIKSLKSITRFSNELARSSVVALDAALRDRMVLDVADKLDAAFIAGDGDIVEGKRTTPLGIINYPGVQEITGIGVLGLDDLFGAIGLALAANVNPRGLRWMMRPETFTALTILKDNDQRYQLEPDVTQAAGFTLRGIPIDITKHIPDNLGVGTDETVAVLWDPSQVAVARDMAPSVKLLDQTFAAYDQQAIRVVAHYDAAPLNPEGIVVLRGITG